MADIQQKPIIPTSIIEEGRGRNIVYTKSDVHYLERYAYVDPMQKYNDAFNMFGHVQVNKRGKFYIHDVNGDTLIVRPHKNCKTTPSGAIGTDRRNYGDGCPVYIKLQQCYDAWMLDDCYDHMLSYSGGDVNLTQEGNEIFSLHQTEAVSMVIRALKTTLFNAGSYDIDKINTEDLWAENITAEKKKRFEQTVNSCEGMRAQARRMAGEGHANMWCEDFIDCNKIDFVKGEYQGDFGEWLRCWVMEKGTPELQYAFDSGIDPGTGTSGAVVTRLSYPLYRLAQAAQRKENKSVATNGTCWTYRDVAGVGPVLYFENRIPVVPNHHSCTWDECLKTQTLHAEVDISNNWQFGTSFRSSPDDPENTTANGDQVALMFQRNNDISSDWYGKWTWLSYSLLFVGIVRPNMYLGGWKTIEKIQK